MSITQTYYLAHTARGKLSSEAARSDHNLRLLVGHANLLDSLMLELADAEQEQESWFNQSVKTASAPAPAHNKHIQWADSIIEEPEEDWQAEDADSSDSEDSDYEEDEDIEMAGTVSLKKLPVQIIMTAPAASAVAQLEDEEEFEEDDEEDYASLSLSRTTSHAASPSSPPELSHHYDSEDSSDDESMPPSPPSTSLPTFSEKQRQQIATTSFYEQSSASISLPEKLSASEQQSFFNDGYYLPARDSVPGLATALVC